MLTITRNEFNTIFVHLGGELIADSATFRRQRGFHNKRTGEWLPAPDFTPRKVKASPVLVTCYLLGTGADPSVANLPVTVAM